MKFKDNSSDQYKQFQFSDYSSDSSRTSDDEFTMKFADSKELLSDAEIITTATSTPHMTSKRPLKSPVDCNETKKLKAPATTGQK